MFYKDLSANKLMTCCEPQIRGCELMIDRIELNISKHFREKIEENIRSKFSSEATKEITVEMKVDREAVRLALRMHSLDERMRSLKEDNEAVICFRKGEEREEELYVGLHRS